MTRLYSGGPLPRTEIVGSTPAVRSYGSPKSCKRCMHHAATKRHVLTFTTLRDKSPETIHDELCIAVGRTKGPMSTPWTIQNPKQPGGHASDTLNCVGLRMILGGLLGQTTEPLGGPVLSCGP
eukprot:scaffold138057_cov30-Prasinocladus_malaysianus.AAC.2